MSRCCGVWGRCLLKSVVCWFVVSATSTSCIICCGWNGCRPAPLFAEVRFWVENVFGLASIYGRVLLENGQLGLVCSFLLICLFISVGEREVGRERVVTALDSCDVKPKTLHKLDLVSFVLWGSAFNDSFHMSNWIVAALKLLLHWKRIFSPVLDLAFGSRMRIDLDPMTCLSHVFRDYQEGE